MASTQRTSGRTSRSKHPRLILLLLALSVYYIIIVYFGGRYFDDEESPVLAEPVEMAGQVLTVLDDNERQVASFDVQVQFQRTTVAADNTLLALKAGPHVVRVFDLGVGEVFDLGVGANPPPPMVKIVGTQLLPVPLTLDSNVWSGTFTLPDGSYKVDCFYGTGRCEQSQAIRFRVRAPFQKKKKPLVLQPAWNNSKSLFPANMAWIHKDQVAGFPRTGQQQYVWTDYTKDRQKWRTVSLDETTTSRLPLGSTVLQQSWFESFRELSNYEIVCWMGGRSAELLHASFLSLKQELFPWQRPFKFHYHHLASLDQPAGTWNNDQTIKFRKCKHIFVTLDEDSFMEDAQGLPLSAAHYREQVTDFLLHLVKAFPDHSFPIWVLTVALESPLRVATTTHHCHSSSTTNNNNLEHNCNRALRDLLMDSSSKAASFPPRDLERIRLLDNTDLSALLGSSGPSPRQVDVLAVISLRIFLLVGRQVQEWRSQGQIGREDGVHRNGIIEPNLDLLPYEWGTNYEGTLVEGAAR